MNSPESGPPAGGPIVLIAEDDPAAASVLDTLLRLTGYEVVLTRDGAECIAALESGPQPDLLVLDWMLPVSSGLEICRTARERWDPVELPILMVTARTDPESITAAFRAGANDYLTKPFLASELRARIAAQLRIKQLVEERRRTDELLMDREKLSSLGVLVSSVAHDLNNPLAGVMAHAQLLLQDEQDPERTGLLDEIVSEVQRCNRIIGDLLGFARRHPNEKQPLPPREVLEETIALRERHLRSVGIRLIKDLGDPVPDVTGVSHQLQQVFLNILINAEHALKDAGDEIAVRLRVGTDSDGGGESVTVEFCNNGPAIPRETLPRIFEPFFTTKAENEGTGLGLAICDRIVREHGGRIDVESGAAGTRFIVSLPARSAVEV